ncbi:histidine kinase dimerization/phospho-acceptor domain-containing protein [Ornithinibacillus scapharcae]|uniref:histidine kinase dimerization/phospho-acceptor domain-containing protein n=1 Tax=Ornithinibacillus scapharcae TaxID=1147159 RepID=UPI000225B62C|nr:histidine kinase dimerization/phospho-acceptor domain-containing protein [Ornithinibacillus scapharcae]
MTFIVSGIFLILLMIILIQTYEKRKMIRDMNEIQEKLSDIIEQKTTEKVLIQTEQKAIQQFLIQVNCLLDYNQQIIADYEKTKESLKRLLSNMSHDLKTPLTVILGYVEILDLDNSMSDGEKKKVISSLHKKY